MHQIVCQRCKKAVATFHCIDIDGQEKRERHYCEKCAADEGIKPMQQHVPINELLTSFVLQQAGAQQIADLKCAQCGMSYSEFRHSGLLGCPNDYDAMMPGLTPLLQRAHDGATHHVGKRPARTAGGGRPAAADTTRKLEGLRRDLEQAVQSEDFERAAQIRDKLRAMESP